MNSGAGSMLYVSTWYLPKVNKLSFYLFQDNLVFSRLQQLRHRRHSSRVQCRSVLVCRFLVYSVSAMSRSERATDHVLVLSEAAHHDVRCMAVDPASLVRETSKRHPGTEDVLLLSVPKLFSFLRGC